MFHDTKYVQNVTQNGIENYKVNATPHMYYKYFPSSKHMFRHTTSRFRVIGHFETSALNHPKMTLEHYEVKGIKSMFYYSPWPAISLPLSL